MKKYPIIFTGAGPGAPDLITVRGMKALEEADYILYAGSLVPEAVLTWAGDAAKKKSSAGLHLDEMVDIMADGWDKGLRVVRLHTGDPSLYGAIAEQMMLLDQREIPYEVIPGVTAAFAAAAALKVEYTVPEQSQTLIFTRISGRTPVPEKESLERLAAHNASMAIYLSAGMAEQVQKVLAATYGPKAPVAVAYRVSHPEERIIVTIVERLAQIMAENEINRLALIIVGPFLETEADARSLLYDRTFAHGYRDKV
ncbi:precorrin-4 C(11)-methyltransferase [Desulfobacter hydrogenophilus]|uniref:Precorrin-4 C(11)-methyltransferase n=1 Tax=Desulfobacter hydrogenophilus TaxID=2291 RepID=A0A328FH27_9BACT|nr:precorrin-4 C(11)-methyltransferase [Desulfobacter hydrogenophilus]NDY71260.1 precorrin-4 C(11)-methyltransferase [Desulfobacter hydrogenophilus]QBH15661.1 precorrin-4 C(11)-methyltransferase [Desulfobacter hydrogenophilus]RAM02792.1 precorrin-4 C(11)-methyltransferase [Desulfobacter hydrogenophilus]